MKRLCLGGSDPALDLTEHQLRQTLIQTFHIDVDLGADLGIWGTPLPPDDQDLISTVDEPQGGLPVARRLFQ